MDSEARAVGKKQSGGLFFRARGFRFVRADIKSGVEGRNFRRVSHVVFYLVGAVDSEARAVGKKQSDGLFFRARGFRFVRAII